MYIHNLKIQFVGGIQILDCCIRCVGGIPRYSFLQSGGKCQILTFSIHYTKWYSRRDTSMYIHNLKIEIVDGILFVVYHQGE